MIKNPEVYQLSDNTWDEREFETLQQVIDTGYFSMGPRVTQFEQEFAQKMGVKYAIMSNSGSSANLLAIAALFYSGRLQRGDEVIVPAVSWSTTYFPVSQYGLRLKFVDIDGQTLNIDTSLIEDAIGPRTRAVFLVNLLGNPCDFDRVRAICEAHNLFFLEDNCESMGAIYKGRQAGTFGLLGSFSTYYSHHLCTMEGGLTVTDDRELYEYMLSLRSHGWTRHLPEQSLLHTKSENKFYESFNFILPGYNLRPIEMEGALGTEQLKKLDRIIAQRRSNAQYFLEQISRIGDGAYRTQSETESSSWFGFAMVLSGPLQGKRDGLVASLEEGGIQVRPIVAGNFTRNKVIQYLDHEICGSLTHSDDIHDNGFFVGNHSRDNRVLQDRLFEILARYHEENR